MRYLVDDGVATRYGIRPAAAGDVAEVSATLADAFVDGDLADWLIPDRPLRVRVYPKYFRIFVEYFIEHGHVDVTDEVDAVALWLPVGDRFEMEIAGYDERLAAVCGPALHRFRLLDATTATHHPVSRPHLYLSHVAVRPARQGHRLGSALLRHRHAQLDRDGTAVYLEATGAANVRFYRRHGYRPRPEAPVAPGALLYPMWRDPAGTANTADTTDAADTTGVGMP
jgi:ribosomal protein S18 acetylase RimI-like enzyme